MAVLCCIFITIDEDNDTAPENIPEQQQQHQGNRPKVGEVWKSEGIICPHKANNILNYFTCFWKYTKEEVTKMIKLELFLGFFTVGYLNTVLTAQINKVLKDSLVLGEFMWWFGFLFYIDSWYGIPERHDWWSLIPPVMHIEGPFSF